MLVLAAACRTVVVSDATLNGGATPRASVDRFLAAARAQDLQALGADFGDDKGALRDHADRSSTERRLLIMLQCLRHDKAVISDPIRSEGGRQIYSVDFTQKTLTATSKFTVVRGPSDRWYVESFEIVPLQNKGFCSKSGG
ncbi:MAG: hypothetical protein ACHQQR_03330 [Gemmatimonadales bacterium]